MRRRPDGTPFSIREKQSGFSLRQRLLLPTACHVNCFLVYMLPRGIVGDVAAFYSPKTLNRILNKTSKS